MLSVGLVAIDATILATAVPVGGRGSRAGSPSFPWLFSIYLLAQAVSVPIYGKLADLRGRKPMMLLGVTLFVLGSVLCGFAWSMPALIAFRLIQGLGAGAIQPIGMTIVGDIYTVAERAKVQGYIASVWGIASFVGPTLGGVFSDYLSWRWIFFVNVPLGLAAGLVVLRNGSRRTSSATTKPPDRLRRHDPARGRRLAAAARPARGRRDVGLGLRRQHRDPGGRGRADSSRSGSSSGGRPSRSCRSWVFGHRVLNSANSSALLVGVLMIGLSTYVPLYAQGVLGTTALIAGFALAAMTIGWPIAASLAGRIYLRLGFRTTMLLGSVFVVIGCGICC